MLATLVEMSFELVLISDIFAEIESEFELIFITLESI